MRLSEYETESTKNVLIAQLMTAISSVFINIFGKFSTLRSVSSLT